MVIFNSYVSLPKGKSLIRQPSWHILAAKAQQKQPLKQRWFATPRISSAPRQRPSFLAPARVITYNL